MKGKSLLYYILIILLNTLLLLPILFSYGLLIPIHILIYWLTFDKIISLNTFTCRWNRNLFALLPSAFQILSLTAILSYQLENSNVPAIIELLSIFYFF